MNPRIEQKIPFDIIDYPSILKWIKNNNGTILFPRRITRCGALPSRNAIPLSPKVNNGVQRYKKGHTHST